MSSRQPLSVNIELLLGEALTDAGFCERLLADPGACARQLQLSEKETQLVLAARAATLRDVVPIEEEAQFVVAVRAERLRKFAALLQTTVYAPTTGGGAAVE